MPRPKTPVSDGKTQHQRFVEAAERLGLKANSETFRGIVRKIAGAPGAKAKKAAKRPKRK